MTNIFLLFGFVLGTVLGSFVKVLADRSLSKESFFGRSHCSRCKHKLGVLDLIPLVSYLALRGKCRYCKLKLSAEYFLVELLMGLLIGLLFFLKIPGGIFELTLARQLIIGFELIFQIFVISVFVSLFLTDIKTGYIPDRITYPAVIIAFTYLVIYSVLRIYLVYQSIVQSVLGKYLLLPGNNYFYSRALDAATPLWSGLLGAIALTIFFASIIILTRGRGMGGGDLKMGVLIGLAFGFVNSLFVLMLSFLLGSVVGILLLLTGKKKFGQTIPFGPFLASAGILMLLWGDQIVDWYLHLDSSSLVMSLQSLRLPF